MTIETTPVPERAPQRDRRRQWEANLARIAELREQQQELDADSEEAKREFDRAFARLTHRPSRRA
jgi:hypothetical protein